MTVDLKLYFFLFLSAVASVLLILQATGVIFQPTQGTKGPGGDATGNATSTPDADGTSSSAPGGGGASTEPADPVIDPVIDPDPVTDDTPGPVVVGMSSMDTFLMVVKILMGVEIGRAHV